MVKPMTAGRGSKENRRGYVFLPWHRKRRRATCPARTARRQATRIPCVGLLNLLGCGQLTTMSKDVPNFLAVPDNVRTDALGRLTMRAAMAVIEEAPIAIFLTEELRIVAINGCARPTFSQIPGALGMELPEFLSRYWAPDAADQTISVFTHTLETGTPYSCIQFTADRASAPATETYNWEVHRLVTADAKRMLICYFARVGA